MHVIVHQHNLANGKSYSHIDRTILGLVLAYFSTRDIPAPFQCVLHAASDQISLVGGKAMMPTLKTGPFL